MPGGSFKTESVHWAQSGTTSASFNSSAHLSWTPGWPLPFSNDDFSNDISNEADKKTVNDSGLSYGSSQDLSNSSEQPDLIAVIASNGERGYIYYDDFHAAEGMSDSIAKGNTLARCEDRDESLAQAFAEAVVDRYGFEVINSQDASDCLELLTASVGMDEALAALNEDIVEGNPDIQIELLSDDEFRALYDSAKEMTDTSLPVYLEDGITQIGSFYVDSI